jgi:hypothetical protein
MEEPPVVPSRVPRGILENRVCWACGRARCAPAWMRGCGGVDGRVEYGRRFSCRGVGSRRVRPPHSAGFGGLRHPGLLPLGCFARCPLFGWHSMPPGIDRYLVPTHPQSLSSACPWFQLTSSDNASFVLRPSSILAVRRRLSPPGQHCPLLARMVKFIQTDPD